MNATQDEELRGRIGRIEALIEEIERFADPAAQAQAREIVHALLEFHGAALSNLVGHIEAAVGPGLGNSRSIRTRRAGVELVAALRAPPPGSPSESRPGSRSGCPQLHSHKGDVELLRIAEGVVRLRMQGSCNGCPSSSATLRQTIEAAIYNAAPDVLAIEVEGVMEASDRPLFPIVTLEPSVGGNGRHHVGST